ncbi:MAG: lipid-A-disaccharide synthase [Akkermansia sp.]|nr:lipid-A-disaccharide synthase [Akkermansia sp.]
MKIFVVAGEKSGDKQGALLIRELLERRPDLEIEGLGGRQMHEAAPAVEDWADAAGVIGLVDVLRHIRFFARRLREMTERIAAAQPECLILIDYPGFNQRLAERVRRVSPNTRIAYFIAPMVWAWHRGRIPKLARVLDLMMCTFPFEKPLFETAGLRTEFVGHPLVEDILARRNPDVREKNLIGLFPGSRRREIERHFPVFLDVVKMARLMHPEWRFMTSASTERLAETMRRMADEAGVPQEAVNITPGLYHDLMDRADAALVTSGTATLEAALHELPFALVYRVAPLTYMVGRLLVDINWIGMVNILQNRTVTTELIQGDFNAENCVEELESLMNPAERAQVLAGMRESVARLGHGGAAAKAAEAVLSLF